MEIKVRKIGNKNKGSKLGRMSKEKKIGYHTKQLSTKPQQHCKLLTIYKCTTRQ